MGMNDSAYDISHLLEQDAITTVAPKLHIVAKPAARPSEVASAQYKLARELMQSAAMHEALIQQYLRMATDTGEDMPL